MIGQNIHGFLVGYILGFKLMSVSKKLEGEKNQITLMQGDWQQ